MKELVEMVHCNNKISQPQGINRMKRSLSSRFQWQYMYRDIENIVRNCNICKRVRHFRVQKRTVKARLKKKSDYLQLDISGERALQKVWSNTVAFVMMDRISNAVMLAELKNKKSEEVCRGITTR